MIWNDRRLSSSAAAGRGGTGRIPHSSLRDAANSSNEFDCTRLRELLVGKYGEAKGGPIFQSLLANSGILEGEGRVLHPVEVKTAATVGADVVKNFACLEGLRGYEVRFGHVICQTKEPYPIIRGLQAVPVWAIWQRR